MKKIAIYSLIFILVITNLNTIESVPSTDSKIIGKNLQNQQIGNKEIINSKIDTKIINQITNTKTSNQLIQNINGISDKNEKITVEVILKNNQSLQNLSEFSDEIQIENHFNTVAQIKIPQNQIITLSKQSYVVYIREPIAASYDYITSEGVGVINADQLHSLYFTGSGVKVAIIDGGFKGYNTNPELPSDSIKEVKSFRSDGDIEANSEHGCACAEIIHDVAPDAELYLFNYNWISELNSAVNYAISKGIDIISYSMGYRAINDYDGIGYDAIGNVCSIVDNARANNVLFIKSAGNHALSHYNGYFRDDDDDNWHEFNSPYETIVLEHVSPGEYVDITLSWNDWPFSDQDFDLVLFDSYGNIVASSTNVQDGSQPPRESISGVSTSGGDYDIAIYKYDASKTVHFELYGRGHDFLISNVPESSISCPADAFGAMVAGATFWQNNNIEGFSSRGPTNDGRIKPDVTAPDGVSTYAYSPSDFYGTSSAAPHTAGAAALLLSAGPLSSADDLQYIIEQSAVDYGPSGKDNSYGSGRIDILQAYNYAKPNADFTTSPDQPNTQTIISFTDTSTNTYGNINLWFWDFGDGTYSTQQNPYHQYADDGIYTIYLAVANENGFTDTTSKQITILNTPPTPSFSYSPQKPITLDTIIFSDTSSDYDGNINAWYWDFDDGITSTLQNPTHKYADDGTYLVKLRVTDDDGDTNQIQRSIKINNTPPSADFNYIPKNPSTRDSIQFQDNSTDSDGTIQTWHWDFDDGNTSTKQNPIHKYKDDGNYNIILNVSDDDGDYHQINKQIYITNVRPDTNFSYTPLYPNTFEQVIFTDTTIDSDGITINWYWDFGDGNTSTFQHPTHTYTIIGNYSITLNVTDDDGATNESTKNITIRSGPIVNFTYNPIYPINDEEITFNDTSIDIDGIIVSWHWDFGDGNTSTQKNPIYSYNKAGNYSITLNTTDNDGINGTKTKNITINSPPNASFTYQPPKPYTSDLIKFTDTSTDLFGPINTWQWHFGEGNSSNQQHPTHQYTDNGTFTIILNITDVYGRSNTTIQSITVLNVAPNVHFTYNPLNPTDIENITFLDVSIDTDGIIVNWTWDLGDGNISYEQQPVHQYTNNGVYNISLNVTDDDGATNETRQQITILNVPPTANLSFFPEIPIINETIQFSDQSTDLDGTIQSWYWDFGDGTNNSEQQPSHQYNQTKTYQVQLRVTDDDGDQDTIIKEIITKKVIQTNLPSQNDTLLIDFLNESNLIITVNTTNSTNLTLSIFSDNPINENSSNNISFMDTYLDISIENESRIQWPINITYYYTTEMLVSLNITETQLNGLYFWNSSNNTWIPYKNTGVNTSYNQTEYEGYIWANIPHLTLLSIGADTKPPSKVTGLTVKNAQNGKLILNWNPATDNIGLDRYLIYRDNVTNVVDSIDSSLTNYQDTGLTNNQQYTYWIRAVDLSNNSGELSEPSTGTPTIPPSNNGGGNSGGGGGGGGFAPPVLNLAPDANASKSQQIGYIDEIILFDASSSTDPDGTIENFTWDFKDGSTGYGKKTSHVFKEPGKYEVELTIVDDEGAKDQDNIIITILKANNPPSTPIIEGPHKGEINESYNFSISSTDFDNDTLQYIINWGDENNTITKFFSNGSIIHVNHSWSKPGVYSISIYSFDNKTQSQTVANKILIDVEYTQDIGYLIDLDNDGIYDMFFSNKSSIKTKVEYRSTGYYLINESGDNSWDYIYDKNGQLSQYIIFEEGNNKTPGFLIFEIIFCVFIFCIFTLKRRK